jgi:hypothetical protein
MYIRIIRNSGTYASESFSVMDWDLESGGRWHGKKMLLLDIYFAGGIFA